MKRACGMLAVVLMAIGGTVFGADHVPVRFGLTTSFGAAYDPGDGEDFVQMSAFALFDYDAVWPHAAPEALRFKIELSGGATTTASHHTTMAIGFHALYYLTALSASDRWRPYVEGGIGLIYNDYKVDGQGSTLNFNPQLTAGLEYEDDAGGVWFIAVRLHHVSNAGINSANRGVNSVMLMTGRHF